jgi:hypothetical protein
MAGSGRRHLAAGGGRGLSRDGSAADDSAPSLRQLAIVVQGHALVRGGERVLRRRVTRYDPSIDCVFRAALSAAVNARGTGAAGRAVRAVVYFRRPW